MNVPAAIRSVKTWRSAAALASAGIAAVLVASHGARLEATSIVFVALAGFSMGSLILLMIGHLMNEDWLAPVRSEAEAAALAMPLLFIVGIPLSVGLDELFPWARGEVALPSGRAAFLGPAFYLARSAVYVLTASAIAYRLVASADPRRVSGIGLALMAPVMTFAGYDWVLSRDPQWWSSLFGFAFALSQVLAALAAAILITLLGPEHAAERRMVSLERALLTLLLLAIWTWFGQFLTVWLSNLPGEAAWYLERSDPVSLTLLGLALTTALVAVIVLVPSGVSRGAMIAGSVLVLLQHGAHMLFIFRPEGWPSWVDLGLAVAAAMLWLAAFARLMRTRPSYADETTEDP